MAGYFNVQKALQSGKSQAEIDSYMSQKGLMPSPAGTAYADTRQTAPADSAGYYTPTMPMSVSPQQDSYEQQPMGGGVVGELLGGAGTFADEFSKIFFKRQNKLAKETYADTMNQLNTGKYKTAAPAEAILSGAGPIAQLGAGALGRATGNQWLGRSDEQLQKVLPAAGEALMYALPIGQAGAISKLATPLQRIGASALVSGVAGGIHGATTEGAKPIERVTKAGMEAATAAATAALITGGIEGGKWLAQKTLKPLANFIGSRVYRPAVGPGKNWASRQSEATQIMLENTKGLTPEQVAQSAADKIDEVTNMVDDQLSQTDKTLPLASKGNPNIDTAKFKDLGLFDQLKKAWNESIAGFRDSGTVGTGTKKAGESLTTEAAAEMKSAAADVQGIIQRQIAMSQGAGGAEVARDAAGNILPQVMKPVYPEATAENLFKAKQAVGGLLRGTKSSTSVWAKIAAGGDVTPREQVYLTAYDTLLDAVDQLSPNTSALTHVQHYLYAIIDGAYNAFKGVSGQSYSVPRMLTGMIGQPLFYGAAKGLNVLGGTSPAINQALQTLGGGITAATVAKQGEVAQ